MTTCIKYYSHSSIHTCGHLHTLSHTPTHTRISNLFISGRHFYYLGIPKDRLTKYSRI